MTVNGAWRIPASCIAQSSAVCEWVEPSTPTKIPDIFFSLLREGCLLINTDATDLPGRVSGTYFSGPTDLWPLATGPLSRSQVAGQVALNGGADRGNQISRARGRDGPELQHVPGEPQADDLAGGQRRPVPTLHRIRLAAVRADSLGQGGQDRAGDKLTQRPGRLLIRGRRAQRPGGSLNSAGTDGRRARGELGQQAFRRHGDRLADRGRKTGPGGEATALDAVADQPARKPAEGPGQLDGVGDPERVGAAGAQPGRQRFGGDVEPVHVARLA